MIDDKILADLLMRWEEAADQGQILSLEELCQGQPEYRDELERKIAVLSAMAWLKTPSPTTLSTTDLRTNLRPRYWSSGQEVISGYRLIKLLGRGGFSEVWEATGPGEVQVALKLVYADRSGIEEKALQILRDIRHPRIVSVFGTWKVPDGIVIAMELAQESVFDRWQRLKTKENPTLSPEDCQAVLLAGAEALDYLNLQNDISHRDVKPHNMLFFENYVKLADFGIARIVTEHSTGHTGYYTLAYAAPEFFRGRTARQSDQYSLAITYTFLRGGKLPFTGSSAEMTFGHLHRSPDLSMLPPQERSAVSRALAKNPQDRWPTCQEFAQVVIQQKKYFWMPTTRRRAIASAAIGTAALLAYLLWPMGQPQPGGQLQPMLKPQPMELLRTFEIPANKPNGLYLRKVVAAIQAVRNGSQLLRQDFYVVGNGMEGAYVWDGWTGKLSRTLSTKPGVGAALPNNERPWALTGHNDGSYDAWLIDRGEQRCQFSGHVAGQHVTSIDLSSDTYRSVTSSTDRTIRVWEMPPPGTTPGNPPMGKMLRQIDTEAYVMCAKFLPNGRVIASVGFDGRLRLWDADTRENIQNINASLSPLWGLDVSYDGNHALTGGVDGIVRLWNLRDYTLVCELIGHTDKVESVAFTPKKDRVISCGWDKTLRVWDLTTRQTIYQADHETEVHSATSILDDRTFLTGSRKSVQAWRLPD